MLGGQGLENDQFIIELPINLFIDQCKQLKKRRLTQQVDLILFDIKDTVLLTFDNNGG